MKWKDENNEMAILKDTSIVNFKEDGSVELYPSTKWIKPRNKKRFGHCHRFKFETKEQAIKVFIELENHFK